MLKMMWNQEAADGATLWSKRCYLSFSNNAAISTTTCGENLLMASNLTSWHEVAELWFTNREYLTQRKGDSRTENYNLQVSESSYMLGCGVSQCPDQRWKYLYFYVCWYCPLGNFLQNNEEPYRLGQNCRDCPKSCDNRLCLPCDHKDKQPNCASLKKSFRCASPLIKDICLKTCNCDGKYAL
ncbi:cysteine-rich secretory protein 2-like [Latimeria chalumnae]|uniref:cysteine-rich secretory protein 2-like n=1 Tax=Latimeria chalumnae TaxID=7897 RepID=UPI00313B2986